MLVRLGKKISSWLNEQIIVGVSSAFVLACLLVANHLGCLPAWWVKEVHDRAPILIVAVGVGIAVLGYLRLRAERFGTRSALAQFNVAQIVAGIVGVLVIAGGVILIATLLAIWFGLFAVPLLSGLRGSVDVVVIGLDRELGTFIVAGGFMALMGVVMAVTYVYQRRWKRAA